MTFRKGAGIGLIVFGILNIIDIASPLIPTVGPSAIVVGLACIGGGLALMGGWKERFAALMAPLRRGIADKRRAVNPLLPVKVLKLASVKGGSLTVSAVAMSLDIGLDDAQAALDELVRKGAADADVDLTTGVATYSFPEFLPK